MLFGHAEQSELKLIGLSYTVIYHWIDRTEDILVACFATSIALVKIVYLQHIIKIILSEYPHFGKVLDL